MTLLFELIKQLIIAAVLLGFIAVNAMFLIWLERRLCARFQVRIGPNRVGFQGCLQPIADMIKLLQKENIVPKDSDQLIHLLAPIVVFTAAFMAYLSLPFGPKLIALDMDMGILYIFAVTTLSVIGILMAGWGSNNKYSLLGGMRSVAQIISYEIPLVLSIFGVIMLSNTLRLPGIVESQKGFFGWYIFQQPLAFVIYIIAATAELNRAPFDIPEAESELTAGYHTEYSGMRFGIFFLAEFTSMFMVSALAVCLFLGGWQGFGILPAPLWFIGKCYAVIFLLIWFRWTFPRLRVDQLMAFGWKILTPLAFLNILVTGLLISVK
ncbi:MAG: NADH-quinone oxidoreductase subunit NuoH [Candidatus Omnitrophica bacterium]|nr:NADH-quinone oxidoreductase subunit NuoH [Candidatus Omnitrophota bacterium]